MSILSTSGNTPVLMHELYSVDSMGDMILRVALTTVMGISLAFPLSRSLIMLSISLLVQSSRKIVDLHGLVK